MPDLIAQGSARQERWRKELPDPASGKEIYLGRVRADWMVPWDKTISGRHLRLTPLTEGRLQVRLLEQVTNPVFFRGEESSDFVMVPGEHFVIGATVFTLANRPGTSPQEKQGDVTEHAYDLQELQRRRFQDAGSRIEMLSHLPDLILGSGSDEELLVRVASVLLRATPSASAVAIVSHQPDPEQIELNQQPELRILHYDSRTLGKESPAISSRLVHHATRTRESVLYMWSAGSTQVAYTASEDVDWAFCVPLRSEACSGWALYVMGLLPKDNQGGIEQSLLDAPQDLEDDVKFAELVGSTIANLRQTIRLERRQSEMRHFFAPIVMNALAGKSTDEVLAPREADLSVMFCDLRGFTERSEQESADLLSLLGSVSDALGTMTKHILETGGVIGDFHGDSAMGFWGWPLAQSDNAIHAISAASKIRQENHSHDPNGFRCGIGIASGRAVAGRIGTVDQVKVTAFGPVVNLASRLEGLTKAFGVEVIMDDVTASALKSRTEVEGYRLRRLAKVRPSGIDSPIEIFELACSKENQDRGLDDSLMVLYEKALSAMMQGDWKIAEECLSSLIEFDQPSRMLHSYMHRYRLVPPDHWDGVMDLPKY
ncbi:MAG: adenylate/guanylate cyclase domain-containing protein [Rubripirellula sp.]